MQKKKDKAVRWILKHGEGTEGIGPFTCRADRVPTAQDSSSRRLRDIFGCPEEEEEEGGQALHPSTTQAKEESHGRHRPTGKSPKLHQGLAVKKTGLLSKPEH